MKPLKILLGNNTLSLLAGSETWTYTLALQLKKMGHSVHCFSPQLGGISQKLENEGIHCFDEISTSGVKPYSIVLQETFDQDYDVIIANHFHIVEFLRSQYPKKPIISTIHGIIHTTQDEKGNEIDAPEHPAMNAGVAQFVAVSEEIRDLLREKYNIDSIIIRNFLDTEHFKAKRKASKTPKQILLNSNYNSKDDPEVQVLREVAKHYGAKLAAVGINFAPTADTKSVIESSDIVFGMGRSVLEGVAMGRLGIVHGRWGTGGVIDEYNIEELRFMNFSGRNAKGELATKEGLIDVIGKFYKTANFEWGKHYIRRDHNVVHAAEMYVQIARELLGQNINPVADSRRPYRRQRDVSRKSS